MRNKRTGRKHGFTEMKLDSLLWTKDVPNEMLTWGSWNVSGFVPSLPGWGASTIATSSRSWSTSSNKELKCKQIVRLNLSIRSCLLKSRWTHYIAWEKHRSQNHGFVKAAEMCSVYMLFQEEQWEVEWAVQIQLSRQSQQAEQKSTEHDVARWIFSRLNQSDLETKETRWSKWQSASKKWYHQYHTQLEKW